MSIEERLTQLEQRLDRPAPVNTGLAIDSLAIENSKVSLLQVWNVLWAEKLKIFLITLVCAIASVVYALSLPNIYVATVKLSPAGDSSGAAGMSKLAGQFGGLASLAGINLGGSNGNDKSVLALEILKSRQFVETLINENDLLVPLMATESWDVFTGEITYKSDFYNLETSEWVREVVPPRTPKPSNWEAYDRFSEIFFISQDADSGIITLALEHQSPELAKQWLSLIVGEINKTMRESDKTEAQNSIKYLESKLEEIQVSGMRTVFYQLIEEQTKKAMLAEVSEDYVFKVIDPPNTPDRKSKPKRPLICVLGTMFGGLIAVFGILMRHFFSTRKTNPN